MSLVAIRGSARHVTVVTLDGIVGFRTVVTFAHNTMRFALVFFFVVVMFEACVAKVSGTEESRDIRYGVKMVVVHEIDVDTRSWIFIGTGNEFITESGADDHHADIQDLFEDRYVVQTGRTIQGNSCKSTQGYGEVSLLGLFFFRICMKLLSGTFRCCMINSRLVFPRLSEVIIFHSSLSQRLSLAQATPMALAIHKWSSFCIVTIVCFSV